MDLEKKHVIVGTAGHIDHGKTTLIQRLTNTDTDRLKEEKERGISIDLGFAYFDLPRGKRAGIIDVPGHEKLVKNMLAGAGGIDVVILVIAADEGLMPQTYEHMNILSFLNIKKGIIAVTKADLVDEEWLELVLEDIKNEIKDTFLEGSPIIPVSAKSGKNIDELVNKIDDLTDEINDKNIEAPSRIPIDRVFKVSGFGTVITGTLISGKIHLNDEIEIMPNAIKARIRSLQVHDEEVDTAFAGQRVALNLAGIKSESLNRGEVIAGKGYITPYKYANARLNLLKSAKKPIKNLDKIRVHIYSSEHVARCILLDKKILKPGENCLVQLRFDEPISTISKDKYVIRSYSPIITIGGGTIIEVGDIKKKPFKKDTIENLRIKEQGSPAEVLGQIILEKSHSFPNEIELKNIFGVKYNETIQSLLNTDLILQGKIKGAKVYIHKLYLDKIEKKTIQLLDSFHKSNPLKKGLPKEELREKLGIKKPQGFDIVLDYFKEKNLIKIYKDKISLKDFEILLTEVQKEIKRILEVEYKNYGYSPPAIIEIIEEKKLSKEDTYKLYEYLIEEGRLIKVKEGIIFHFDIYNKAKEEITKLLDDNAEIEMSEFRDALKTSRKYALPLLEHFDEIKFTKRIGDKRVLYK